MASKAIVTTQQTGQGAALTPYIESARKYAKKSKAPHTLTVYSSAWREFESFAAAHGWAALPAQPDTVKAQRHLCL